MNAAMTTAHTKTSLPASEAEKLPKQYDPFQNSGILAQRLRQVFDKAVTKVIQTCSYRNFAQCFPTSAENAPQQLHDIWRQMNSNFVSRMRREFEIILENRSVIKSLNNLDQLLNQADTWRKVSYKAGEAVVAPSTLSPDAVMSAHLIPLLLNAQKQVTEKIDTTRVENENMITFVEEQRREVEQLVGALEQNMLYISLPFDGSR